MKIIGLIVLFLIVLLIIAFVILKSRKKESQDGVIDVSESPKVKQVETHTPKVETAEAKEANEPKSTEMVAEDVSADTSTHQPCAATPAKRKKVDTGDLVHILVAEDNLSNYKLVEVMLRNLAVTENAINGKVAVERVREVEYDMVFMDVKMPVMNGLEATQEIRKFDTKVPIIAVTANVLDFDKNMALASGCNEFVPKPITRKRLCEVVETYNKRK